MTRATYGLGTGQAPVNQVGVAVAAGLPFSATVNDRSAPTAGQGVNGLATRAISQLFAAWVVDWSAVYGSWGLEALFEHEKGLVAARLRPGLPPGVPS